MKAKGFATAYELAKASGGQLNQRTAYRLVDSDGEIQQITGSTLEALADVLDVDVPDLFQRKAKR